MNGWFGMIEVAGDGYSRRMGHFRFGKAMT
jgi:hypothetical protein